MTETESAILAHARRCAPAESCGFVVSTPEGERYFPCVNMVLGGVAQMLAPKARTPRTQTTDNGKQNTYFSSLDNMVAQGNVLPVLYGEMRVGSRVVSQEISTADEGDGGQVVVIGR